MISNANYSKSHVMSSGPFSHDATHLNTYAVSWNLGNWTLFFTSNVKSLAAPRSGIVLLNEETEHFSVKLPGRPNKIIAVSTISHFSFYWSDSKFFCITQTYLPNLSNIPHLTKKIENKARLKTNLNLIFILIYH